MPYSGNTAPTGELGLVESPRTGPHNKTRWPLMLFSQMKSHCSSSRSSITHGSTSPSIRQSLSALSLQVEHRDCAAWNHGHREFAVPFLGLHEINQRRISGERLAARIDGVGFGAAAQLDGVGLRLRLEPHAIGLRLRLGHDDLGLHPLTL